MPKVKPSAAEERRTELSARIQYQMARRGYNNKKMAQLLGISESTFTNKKLHAPDEFTMSDVWNMEKIFGCKLSDPLKMEVGA